MESNLYRDVIINNSADIKLDIQLGNHISIDNGVYISTQATIGDYVHIAPYVCIIGGSNAKLIMGNFTNIGAGSKIIIIGDDFNEGLINPIVPIKYRNLIGDNFIMEDFSLIGVNCVVLPNVKMAEGSVLGANSLLNRNTDPWTIYVGSPAKPLKKRNKEQIIKYAKELGYGF
jgi:acetyltransferase-like isoleucine patch superfamily enzyme